MSAPSTASCGSPVCRTPAGGLREAVPVGARDHELRSEQRAAFGKRARDVVRVPDISDAYALDAAEQLLNGQQIGQALQRVIAVREHVEHGRLDRFAMRSRTA
jgi:hypothetical protein